MVPSAIFLSVPYGTFEPFATTGQAPRDALSRWITNSYKDGEGVIMAADGKPAFGLKQPACEPIPYGGVHIPPPFQNDRRFRRELEELLDDIAANLERLMRSSERLTPANRVQSLADQTGLGKGTIQRILGGSRGYGGQDPQSPRVATLMCLAWFFDVSPLTFFYAQDRKSRALARDLPPSPNDSVSERDLKSMGDGPHPRPARVRRAG